MKRIDLFRGEDGREFEVPEDEQENFQQEMQDIPVSRIEKYRGEDGREFDVPEQERDAFMQEMQGLKIDRIRTVKAGGDVWDVPESEAQGFAEFYRNDPRFDTEREEKAKTIASELDAPDSPLWAGIKTFFSPKNYAENATLEGVSATSANVLRGAAQAPATISDKLAAVEQFGSRVRELPGAKGAMLMTPYGVMGLAGEGVEAILSLNGKDGGKQYRDLIQKARDYVDGKREEFLGYRNEKGQKATADDFAVTIGGQAVNSVAESYLLTAPKIMQGINGMMQAGGKGLLARMTPTLQTMLYGASTAEGTAGKAEAKGMSNEKAVGVGLLTGTIESALESVSQVTGLQDAMSKNALKEAVARTVWKKAGEVLKDATGEGLTEFGQQAQQGTIEKLSKIDEKSWGQIGMKSASAAALAFIAGGSSASAKGIFDSTTPRQGAALPGDALPNLEVSNEQVRMEQEAQAVGEGERAQRESVLEGTEAQGEAGEGAQPAAMDQPGQDTRGGVRVGDPALAGENRLGFEGGEAVPEPLQIADGVFAEPMETPRQGEALPGTVKIRLASGKQIYSNDPGLAALVEYWYKDRVLFPPAPAGDTGRQAGPKQITDGATRQGEAAPALNASRRAGFQIKPAKRVLINIGRSKDSYRGTIVQILDGQTVRVKIDKTQRSLKNSRAGYADVDVRQLSQFANVVGKQNYLDLMKGMTEEQKKKVEADAKAFKDELIDVGLFLDQDAWKYVDGVKGSKARTTKDDLIKDAYARASDMMGIPLDNHIQRAQALPILQEFHTRMQGSEGLPYDAYAERAAREGEQEMADRRASGEFSLADLTPEEMAQADARLEAQRIAESQRAEIMRRAQAPITGTTGDMTGIIPGMEDFTFDDTPLFGVRNEQSPIDNAGQKTVNPGTTNGKGLVAIVDESNFKQFQKPAAKAYLDAINRLGKMEVSGPESTAKLILEHTGVKLFYDENPPDDFGFVYVNDPKNGKAKQVDNGSVDTGEELPFNMAPVNTKIVTDSKGNVNGVFYRGTSKEWNSFTGAPDGIFFTRDPNVAKLYGGNITAAKLNGRFLTVTPSELERLDQFIGALTPQDKENGYKSYYDSSDALLRKAIGEQIKREGWDGYIIPNDAHWVPGTPDTDSIAVFNPESVVIEADKNQYNVAPEAAGVYNQESSGGADTPRAQEQAAEKTPINTPPWMQERNAVGMDLMDAVGMVYQLTGKFPKVMEKLRRTRALGYFDPNTKEIVLWAKIFGLVDDQDRARITKALKDKGFEGEKLYAQEAIEVKALMEKRRKEHQKRPLKVAVHELAHLVDFLPDGTMKRGNILGHVAALTKYLKQAIGPEPGAPGPMTEKEKSDLRRRAEREMKDLLGEARTVIEEVIREVPEYKVLGITPDDVKGLLGMDSRTATPELYDWFTRQESDVKRDVLKAAMQGVVEERTAEFANKQQVGTRTVIERIQREVPGYTKEAGRKRFRELLAEEAQRRRLIELKRIKEEARAIIPWWRGVDKMEAYFEKPEEMYAELMGIFLADPSELQLRAPTVFRAFTGWMEARPEVADAYRAFLDARALPVEERMKLKFIQFRKGRNKADEDDRREVLKEMMEPSKALRKAEFRYFFHRKSAPTKMALDESLDTLIDAASTPQDKARIQKIYEQARVQIKKLSALGWRTRYYESTVDTRVADPLKKAGFDMFDLDEYQSLMRIAYELGGKAAPAGVEPATALQMLDHRRKEYGEERFAVLERAANEFRKIREQEILSNEDLRRMYSDELLEKFDNNKQYVTFSHVRTLEEMNRIKKSLRDRKSKDKGIATDAVDVLSQEIEGRLGSTIGAKIYKYVGSFGNIKNTIVATLEKDDQMIRAATRNRLKIMVAEMAGQAGIFEYVMPAQMERNSKGIMVPVMVDNDNWRTVVYMDKGVVKGFVAMKPLADSLEKGSFRNIASMKKALKANNLFTGLLTRFKFGFAMLNNMKDVAAAANQVPGLDRMGLPGISINFIPGGPLLSTLQRYRMFEVPTKAILSKVGAYNKNSIEWNLGPGRRAAIIIQKSSFAKTEDRIQELIKAKQFKAAESLKKDLELALEGVNNPIIMSYLEAISEEGTMNDYERRMFRSGMDISNGLNVAAHVRGVFRNVGFMLERWGETGELTTKLAVWNALKDRTDISHEQKILITRELGGSPDFSESGSVRSYVEFATRPFVNAAKEGTLASIDSFKRDPSGASIKMMKHAVLPTLARWALGSGFLLELFRFMVPDEEDREKYWGYGFLKWYYKAMSNVPNYQKKFFHTNPLPINPESGAYTSDIGSAWSVVLSAPMDHITQIVSSSLWNSLDSAGEGLLDQFKRSRDPNAAPTVLSTTVSPSNEIKDLVLSSFLPIASAESPVLKIAALSWGYIWGSNYHDSFRDRDVWTENELLARFKTHDATERLGVELWNSLGGTSIFRLKAGDNLNSENPPSLHNFLNLPFIQPLLGNVVKIQTGGRNEMERKLVSITKDMEAPIKLEAKADLARAIKEGGGVQPSIGRDILNKMTASDGTYLSSINAEIYKDEFFRLLNKYQGNELKRGDIGDLMRLSNEDNRLMMGVRMNIMDRRR